MSVTQLANFDRKYCFGQLNIKAHHFICIEQQLAKEKIKAGKQNSLQKKYCSKAQQTSNKMKPKEILIISKGPNTQVKKMIKRNLVIALKLSENQLQQEIKQTGKQTKEIVSEKIKMQSRIVF